MENYTYIVRGRIIPALGKLKIKKVTSKDIDKAINDMYDEEYSKNYIYDVFNMMRQTFRQALKWNMIEKRYF
jgi:hypothetical protein